MDPVITNADQDTQPQTPIAPPSPAIVPEKKAGINMTVVVLSLLSVVLLLATGFLFYQNNQLRSQLSQTVSTSPTPVVSVTPSVGVTLEQALQTVSNIPEVKTFVAQTASAHVAVSDIDSTGSFWAVHVYESFPDHNATFHWYDVDKTSGVVTKQI